MESYRGCPVGPPGDVGEPHREPDPRPGYELVNPSGEQTYFVCVDCGLRVDPQYQSQHPSLCVVHDDKLWAQQEGARP
jgi:hypothetical protein